MMLLIDPNEFEELFNKQVEYGATDLFDAVDDALQDSQIIKAVPMDDYNNLRNSFIDYVCSGIQNPAPYCKNSCEECVNEYGYCMIGSDKCKGFNPDVVQKEE